MDSNLAYFVKYISICGAIFGSMGFMWVFTEDLLSISKVNGIALLIYSCINLTYVVQWALYCCEVFPRITLLFVAQIIMGICGTILFLTSNWETLCNGRETMCYSMNTMYSFGPILVGVLYRGVYRVVEMNQARHKRSVMNDILDIIVQRQ